MEADEESRTDNSTGRLLTLSDGVFAIAMTLLALDLRLPDLSEGLTDAGLRHALADDWQAYVAYAISFLVVFGYWNDHRRMMRLVETVDGRLIGRTMRVLILVAAVPFPTSVLAEHGNLPSALILYAGYNIAVGLALLSLRAVIPAPPGAKDDADVVGAWADVAAFPVAILAAPFLHEKGPWVLALLVISGRTPAVLRARRAKLRP